MKLAASAIATRSLISRLHEWWEGVGGEPVEQPDLSASPSAVSSRAASLRARIARGDPAIIATELLWGEGRVGPGEAAADVRQTASLAVGSNSSVCWLGVGMAAPAASVAAASGAYVTGLEWRDDWLARGREVAAAAGLGRRLTCEPMTFDPLSLPDRRFDAFCAMERLNEAPDLAALLDAARGALKDDGLILFIETVSEDEPEEDDASAAPLTVAGWRAMLSQAGFDMRVVEEVTGSAIAREQAAWGRFLRELSVLAEIAAAEPRVRSVLGKVVELLLASQNRLKALEQGDLAVYRFVAARSRRGG